MESAKDPGKSLRSPAAQILETALALQRAPGERFRLRERPLSPGVIHLMEIAASSPQAVDMASAELGEPGPILVEAARFYLEQVLLADPDANAYRVLGVEPTAAFDTIRNHHRWLQRWLHPDRALAGDASVFATRVNQAFAQLRTPELRHQYDVRLAEARLAGASAPLASETLRHWEHGDEIAAPTVGRRSRWLLAAALVSCLVLAVLIVRNPENAVEWHPDGEGASGSATTEVHDAPAIEDRDLGVLSEALSAPRNPEKPVAEPVEAPGPAVPEQLAVAGDVGAQPQLPTAPVPSGLQPVRTTAPRGAPAQPGPVRSTQAVTRASPPVAPAPSPAVPTQVAPVGGPPVTAAPGDAPAAATPETPAAAPALSQERMRLAEQGVEQVVGYFRAQPGAFPLWNDPAVQTKANQLRSALNARSGSFQLRDLDWKVASDVASLDAAYRCQPAAKGDCEGRLLVDLVWRQGYWFVRRVSLAPSA